MVRKRKSDDISDDDDKAPAWKRNKASPFALANLINFTNEDQKTAVVGMELDSLLDVKCHFLHDRLIHWFCGLYDKHSWEFVIPGWGRIPLDELSMYRTLGLPLGTHPVPYAIDSDIEEQLGPQLFGDLGSTPMRTKVFEILKNLQSAGVAFKQTWVMYVLSTVLPPTTCNNVSNRCYPIMGNIGNVQNLQWCKFVADRIHEKLSKRKFRQICLFALMLLYVNSLDVSSLNLNLPEGCFAVNIWSRADIDAVLAADLQNDGKTYGKLELKPEFGLNYSIFGGADGFTKWFDTHSDPTCPVEQKAQVANLMGSFVSGMAGLMGSLVQGWTSMRGDGAALMENKFGSIAQGFLTGLSKSSAPAEMVTKARPSRAKSSAPAETVTKAGPTRAKSSAPAEMVTKAGPKAGYATRSKGATVGYASVVQRYFRKDQSYKLSHKDLLNFPVLQNIGTEKKPCGHWFVLSVNFKAKRFEILDSLRGEDDEEMIRHATRLVDAIKVMYKVNYSQSKKQIDEYELMYIPVPKHGPILNCGIFMLKNLELWHGSAMPAVTADQIDAIRRVMTATWLEHDDNKLLNWRVLLDNNMF